MRLRCVRLYASTLSKIHLWLATSERGRRAEGSLTRSLVIRSRAWRAGGDGAEHTRGGWGKRQRWGGADGTAGLAAHIGRDVRRELEVDL